MRGGTVHSEACRGCNKAASVSIRRLLSVLLRSTVLDAVAVELSSNAGWGLGNGSEHYLTTLGRLRVRGEGPSAPHSGPRNHFPQAMPTSRVALALAKKTLQPPPRPPSTLVRPLLIFASPWRNQTTDQRRLALVGSATRSRDAWLFRRSRVRLDVSSCRLKSTQSNDMAHQRQSRRVAATFVGGQICIKERRSDDSPPSLRHCCLFGTHRNSTP